MAVAVLNENEQKITRKKIILKSNLTFSIKCSSFHFHRILTMILLICFSRVQSFIFKDFQTTDKAEML
jgi:hypothetical protein